MINYAIRLLTRLLIKRHPFRIGDLVCSAYGDAVFEVNALYYTLDLKPIIVIRDHDNRVYSVDPVGYVHYGGSVNI